MGYQKPSFKEVRQCNGKDNKRVRSRHSKKSENTMAKITNGSEAVIQRSLTIQWQSFFIIVIVLSDFFL
jgi:hypothetical protein